jgi:hypothetical protein
VLIVLVKGGIVKHGDSLKRLLHRGDAETRRKTQRRVD